MDTHAIAQKAAELLGIKSGDIDIDSAIKRGFSPKEVSHLQKALNLSDLALSRFIGISIKTLQRKRTHCSHLTLQESDRIYRIARIFAQAAIVFGDIAEAREWMMDRQYILGNEIPFILMQIGVGAKEVENALGRIAYGVLV